MKLRQHATGAALELVKGFEGLRLRAARLPDGRWTIGYGHLQSAREGAQVSEADAEALLIYDLMQVAEGVRELVYTPLNQNQFDALCAFVFNIGLDAFKGSGVLRRLNEGKLLEAACAMELWRRATIDGESLILDALIRRRAAEKILFLTPPEGWVAAPSALIAPRLDSDPDGLVPRSPPVVVEVCEDGDEIAAPTAAPAEPRPTPPPEDIDAQSPLDRAVAGLAARLQAIAVEPPGPFPAPLRGAPEPEPAFEALAPFQPSSEGQQDEGAITPAPLAEATAPAGRTQKPRIRRRTGGLAPVIALGALGLAGFALALYWAFSAPTQGQTAAGLVSVWVVGVLGIGAFGVAAYLLLERLAGLET